MKKKIFSLLLVMFMLFGFAGTQVQAAPDLESNINACADFIIKNNENNEFDSWQIPSLLKLNKLNDAQKNSIKKNIDDSFNDDMYSTDIAKNIFALNYLGYDVQNYNGHDLVNEMLAKNDYLGSTNYGAWVLTAASKGNYKLNDASKKAIDDIIADIIKNQETSGGFDYAYKGGWVDVDSTGMAVYALSSYKDRTDVQESVKKGIKFIKDNYNNGLIDNSNTLDMAILGLYPYGEVTDNMISDLLTYQKADGSFIWKKDDEGSIDFATEQALYTLVSYKYGDVFDFTKMNSNKPSAGENAGNTGSGENNKPSAGENAGSNENNKPSAGENAGNNENNKPSAGENAGDVSSDENNSENNTPSDDNNEDEAYIKPEKTAGVKTGDMDILLISSLCFIAVAGMALSRKENGIKACRK